MKKLVLLLLVLVLVAYISVQFFLDSALKTAVNQAGPRLTQSNVVLEDAAVSPLSGKGSLTGLTVGNPKGWSDTRAIYLGHMSFDVEPMSFFKDAIVVNDLTIDQPEFNYETRLVSSNIGDLMKNIEAAVGPTTEPQEKDAKQRKFIVKHFRLQDAKVTVGVGSTTVPLNMPPVELHDLGVKEGGLTPSQLAFAIMKAITPDIIRAATESSGGIPIGAGDAIKKANEGLQKILGGGKK